MNRLSVRRLWPFLIVALAAIPLNIWSLNSSHFFYADDWGWLERVAFESWGDILHIFPTQIYNSRPGGEFIIRAMYEFCGLNSHPYNVLWLFLHVANCVIFFIIAAKLLPVGRALAAAVLAGSWYSTLVAVHWIGAIFDLAGATWCLLCLLFYLQASDGKPRWWLWLIASIAMHILAIRTKEFALALVALLACWEFLVVRGQDLRQRTIRLAPHVLVTLIYAVAYFRLYEVDKAFVSTGSYKIGISLQSIIENAGYYFSQAFYATGTGERALIIGYAALVVVTLIGMTSRAALVGLLSASALMAAVLLMPNQKNALYLYAPHFFLAITLCAVLPRCRVVTVLVTAMVALIIAWPLYSHEWKWSRDFYLINGSYSKGLFDDYIGQFGSHPPANSMTIGVSRPYFDPFSWGGGSALRIYYRDPSIKVHILNLSKKSGRACADVVGTCLIEQHGHLVAR